MNTLDDFLRSRNTTDDVKKIIQSLAAASMESYAGIRLADTLKNKDENTSGDTQSALDILSDAIFTEHLKDTGCVQTIASEEQHELIEIPTSSASYFVAYDPYDGGGVGDVNMSFGSIIGIWKQTPLGKSVGNDLVCSLYTLYGPRLTLVITLGDAPIIFEYDEVSGNFELLKEQCKISENTTHCSPGNFRNVKQSASYRKVIDNWLAGDYKLLYAGALVTDINHILMKGHGIFTYPSDNKHPNGKLRLLYEGGPLGMIIEKAGGRATTQSGKRLLDQVINETHQRETFLLGSKNEVEKVVEVFNK